MLSNVKIRATYLLFDGVVCAGMVMLICTSAQAQNLFESDGGSGNIYELTAGGAQSTFASGLGDPGGMAFNGAGDLFVANAHNGTITKIMPGGAQSVFASGLNEPFGLAFNNAGNLFAADYGSGNIYEFTPDGTRSTFASEGGMTGSPWQWVCPVLLAFDGEGNLFVANDFIYNIAKFTPGGAQSIFASGLNSPSGLAFTSTGDLFVSQSSGSIIEITPGGAQSTFASGLDYPIGVVFQPVPELMAVVTNGVVQVAVSMPSPYHSTIIQASTDMVNWANVYTNTPPFTFADSMATNFPCRFYRALLGP